MAVTVTYLWPATGVTAPTIATGLADKVRADVIASADGDVAATITHNMAISAADLLLGKPEVYLTPILSQALTALPMWAATSILTNTVVLTKLASVGSGNAAAQLRVYVSRPNTYGQ